MNLKTLMLFLSFLMPTMGLGQITESECGSFDFSQNFPPVRDQNGVGYCWAFASSALVEEELCKDSQRPGYTGSYKCGNQVSVLDMSRCNFRFGTKFNDGEGGNASEALECILNPQPRYTKLNYNKAKRSAEMNYVSTPHVPGVCPETVAPFYNLRKGIRGFIDLSSRGIDAPASMNDYLAKLNNQCQNQLAGAPLPTDKEVVLLHFEKILKKLLPLQDSSGVDFKDALKAGQIQEEFLRDLFIPARCAETRNMPQRKLKVESENFRGADVYTQKWDGKSTISKHEKLPDKSVREKLSSISKAFHAGQSVAAGICYNQYVADSEKDKKRKTKSLLPVSSDDCGGHALVYQGLRWSKEKNRCEILVRNSWGQGSNLSGWEDAEKTLKHTQHMSYLKAVNP